MQSENVNKWFPCSAFFAEGRIGAGVAALAMQATLVMWPAAVHWARTSQDRNDIDKMLNELSDTHCTAQVKYRTTTKRFRQTA
jgi:hypothetical protein